MIKIRELHRQNANLWIGGCIGLIVAVLVSIMSIKIIGLDILMYLQKEAKIVEILMILPTMLVIFIGHEFIHIGFYHVFGKGEAKIKVIREKSVGAIMMH